METYLKNCGWSFVFVLTIMMSQEKKLEEEDEALIKSVVFHVCVPNVLSLAVIPFLFLIHLLCFEV